MPSPRTDPMTDRAMDQTTDEDGPLTRPDAPGTSGDRLAARDGEHPEASAGMAVADRTEGLESGGPEETASLCEAPEPPAIHRLGRYVVEGRIGQGGFGQVFLARDDELKRLVAIKLADRLMVYDADVSEARIVAGLDHPHIVPVYDIGRTDAGRLFIVTKLIDGRDLAARLREGRLPLEQVVDLVRLIATGLHHAHERGLVHRDIKPGNILLDRAGRPYVCRLRAGAAGRGLRAGRRGSRARPPT